MSRNSRIQIALGDKRFSIEYKLVLIKELLDLNQVNEKIFFGYIELVEKVLGKYHFESDVLLRPFVKVNEVINFTMNWADQEFDEDMLKDFLETYQLPLLMEEHSFFCVRFFGDKYLTLVPIKDFITVFNKFRNQIVISELRKFTRLEHLEIVQQKELESIGRYSFESNYKTLDREKLYFVNKLDQLTIGENMNQQDVSSVFKSFERAKTEEEIKNILREIDDQSVLKQILDRVTVDYDKILSVFEEVGEDGLDIDIIIACLYVELKAKWIQLNIKSQYQAFNSRPVDMVSLGHASVVSHFLSKIEPYLDMSYMKTIDKLLAEPMAA